MTNILSSAGLVTTGLACFGLAAAFIVGPASADVPNKDPRFEFKFYYQPTELATPATAQKMLDRLESEVRDRCGRPSETSIEERRLVNKCVRATMRSTINSFGSTTVAEAYHSDSAG